MKNTFYFNIKWIVESATSYLAVNIFNIFWTITELGIVPQHGLQQLVVEVALDSCIEWDTCEGIYVNETFFLLLKNKHFDGEAAKIYNT